MCFGRRRRNPRWRLKDLALLPPAVFPEVERAQALQRGQIDEERAVAPGVTEHVGLHGSVRLGPLTHHKTLDAQRGLNFFRGGTDAASVL